MQERKRKGLIGNVINNGPNGFCFTKSFLDGDSRSSRGEAKKVPRAIAPISLEDMMDKEVLSSSKDGEIRELSVLSDPSNENSTKIKQRIKILTHPKNLMEVLRARVAIEKGLIGNAINYGPNGF